MLSKSYYLCVDGSAKLLTFPRFVNAHKCINRLNDVFWFGNQVYTRSSMDEFLVAYMHAKLSGKVANKDSCSDDDSLFLHLEEVSTLER